LGRGGQGTELVRRGTLCDKGKRPISFKYIGKRNFIKDGVNGKRPQREIIIKRERFGERGTNPRKTTGGGPWRIKRT